MELTHATSEARLQALYSHALSEQWSAETALDWEGLSFSQLTQRTRTAMAAVYGDVLRAEAIGMDAVNRMVELAPEGWHRDFAKVQLLDEVRHIDFFSRVVGKVGVAGDDSEELRVLGSLLDGIEDYSELLLHAQIMETAARVIFVGNGQRTLDLLARGIKLPGTEMVRRLLSAIVELVGKDESRHIAIGSLCLQSYASSCDAGALVLLEDRARVTARLMYDAFARRSEQFAILGMPPADVLERTWNALRTQLGRLELDIGVAR